VYDAGLKVLVIRYIVRTNNCVASTQYFWDHCVVMEYK
jgi:hypothetical protein